MRNVFIIQIVCTELVLLALAKLAFANTEHPISEQISWKIQLTFEQFLVQRFRLYA